MTRQFRMPKDRYAYFEMAAGDPQPQFEAIHWIVVPVLAICFFAIHAIARPASQSKQRRDSGLTAD